jgi:Fur family ferric uptake transcriptional regulator
MNLLKQKKISETPFRKEVLAIFKSYKNAIPLSVLENELTNFNRITLYRTIKIFIEKGIIHEITLSGNDTNYAICQNECSSNTHHHQHIHFKCNNCHLIFCAEIDKFPNVSLPGYKIDNLEIQATGLCKTCHF